MKLNMLKSKIHRATVTEAKNHNPIVVFVDDNKSIAEIKNYEKHGEIK